MHTVESALQPAAGHGQAIAAGSVALWLRIHVYEIDGGSVAERHRRPQDAPAHGAVVREILYMDYTGKV